MYTHTHVSTNLAQTHMQMRVCVCMYNTYLYRIRVHVGTNLAQTQILASIKEVGPSARLAEAPSNFPLAPALLGHTPLHKGSPVDETVHLRVQIVEELIEQPRF